MGGKRNKSKKFLRQRFNKKHNKNNKKKQNDANAKNMMTPSPSKQESKKTKKARDLFNAGINALDEQPDLDKGLTYTKSDDIGDIDNDADSMNGDAPNDHQSDDWSDVMSLQSEVTVEDDLMLELA
eukprot:530783_1